MDINIILNNIEGIIYSACDLFLNNGIKPFFNDYLLIIFTYITYICKMIPNVVTHSVRCFNSLIFNNLIKNLNNKKK